MENKEITIYELIGLIKDNKAPNKVFYKGSEYKFCNDIGDYRRLGWEHCLIIKDIFTFDTYSHNSLYNMLNDTVEFLPEENDEWEEMKEMDIGWLSETKPDNTLFLHLINLLIKNQKYLKERLDKNGFE